MTVEKARAILKGEIQNLSNQEVKEMIDRDLLFCDSLLDVIMAIPEKSLTNYEKQN